MPQLIQIEIQKRNVRILMAVVVGLAVIWTFFVLRWYLGNMMADYLDLTDSDSTAARRAVSLGPNDPLTHWRLGEFIQRRLPSDKMPEAVRHFEQSVRLSPNDYRLWMALGTALEQTGEVQKGEQALRRAIALAPAYALPRWYLGNLLLRSGRYDESFAELRLASERNADFRPQLFNLAWELYQEDIESLTKAVGVGASSRADFAAYLVGRQRVDDGLRLWDTLTAEEKTANRQVGEQIVRDLIAAKLFHKAIEISNEIVAINGYQAAVGQFVNGGFEIDVPRSAGAVFAWRVETLLAVQTGMDPSRWHNGRRSLRLTYQVRSKVDGPNVSQLIPVIPGKEYEIEYYVRTEKLEGDGTPRIEVTDAVTGSLLGVSNPAPNGTFDWQPDLFTFTSGAESEAIIVRINRSPCEDKSICPIFGTVWYDDLNLKSRN